jgi:hypothetical protein
MIDSLFSLPGSNLEASQTFLLQANARDGSAWYPGDVNMVSARRLHPNQWTSVLFDAKYFIHFGMSWTMLVEHIFFMFFVIQILKYLIDLSFISCWSMHRIRFGV